MKAIPCTRSLSKIAVLPRALLGFSIKKVHEIRSQHRNYEHRVTENDQYTALPEVMMTML